VDACIRALGKSTQQMTDFPIRVLMVTCEWPSDDMPYQAPFVVRQVEFLRKAGVDVDVFAFRGAQKPANYLRAWARVHRKLRHGSYDLVHAQWGQSALTALPTRLPLVVTFRGGEGEGIVGADGSYTARGRILQAIGSIIARRADELIVVSAHMQQYLPSRAFHVVPSGLDLSRLPLLPQAEARRQLGLPSSKRLVLFVGDPGEARKRYALALDIVSRLPQTLDAELVVAWNVRHDLVPVYMNACDALLFTSMYEGSPNVIKESLACNLPIVSTAVGDVHERLAGVGGCVVCPDADPVRMAAALSTLLHKRERTDGRSTVLELDETLLAQRTIGIYQRALSKTGHRSRQSTVLEPLEGSSADRRIR
jgi:teichuronic acid biosynthesis glycosyltransferase TuaC